LYTALRNTFPLQVLAGVYYYAWGDHGGILAAVAKFGATDTLWYSGDLGK